MSSTIKEFRGYRFQNTMRGVWYVTSRKYGNLLGPFKTRRAALEYAQAIDGGE